MRDIFAELPVTCIAFLLLADLPKIHDLSFLFKPLLGMDRRFGFYVINT